MDIITKLNTECISELKIFYKKEVTNPKYRPKTFWNKAGFYDALDTFYTVETIFKMDPNVYIENNIIYFKPHIAVRMASREQYYKYFETKEELDQFLFTANINRLNWIMI